MTVDGAARPKNHRVGRGGADRGRGPSRRRRGPPPPAAATFDDRLRGRAAAGRRQARGARDASGAGPPRGDARRAAARAGRSVVHRLDKDTSGLLLVARSEEALAALQRHDEGARDHARVHGARRGPSGRRAAARSTPRSGATAANRTVMSTRTDRARDAVTHFEVLERLPRTSLLRVRLETGRTHQIRAHLAAIGHPVVGDPQYGGSASGRRLGLARQFLHASSLMFRHPFTGELVRCESKPPVELSHAIDTARREPVSGGPDGG